MNKTLKNSQIEECIKIIESHYKNWNSPVITYISTRGASPFKILLSTVLSLRTKDEVTMEASKRLFLEAKTPEEVISLGVTRIEELIYPVGFYHTKASRLVEISKIIIEKYQRKVPADLDELLTLPGVGRKTANLVLAEGFNIDAICVDTHVHRINNRLGYVSTKTPDKTEMALREKLPKKYWIKYNTMLVAFGQVICRPVSPFCSKCPVNHLCCRIAVKTHR